MKGSIKLNLLVLFLIIFSVGSVLYFFSSPQSSSTNIQDLIPAGSGGTSLGIGLYGSDGKLLGVVSDSANPYALYTVNTIPNVYSFTISGSVCVLSPYKIIIEGFSNIPLIKNVLDTAVLSKEIGKTVDGKSVADLKAGECSSFTTSQIILDNLGEGMFQASFRAYGYTTYASGEATQLIEEVDSNIMNLNVTIQPSIIVDVNFSPSTGTTTTVSTGATTTVPSGATTTTTIPSGTGTPQTIKTLNHTTTFQYGNCASTSASAFVCNTTIYSSCLITCTSTDGKYVKTYNPVGKTGCSFVSYTGGTYYNCVMTGFAI